MAAAGSTTTPRPVAVLGGVRLNVRGSSLAAGHPFAAAGARIAATRAKPPYERAAAPDAAGSGRGPSSIRAAGGLGVTLILQGPAPRGMR